MDSLALPFSVTEYTNPRSGSQSFRVSGSHHVAGPKGRLRKNFSDRHQAQLFCDAKNAEALRFDQRQEPVRVTSTRLTDAELTLVEAVKARKRWPLADIIAAGEAALLRLPNDQLVEPLLDAWLDEHEGVLADRWFHTIRKSVRMFQRDHPKLTTSDFTKATFLKWLNNLRRPDGKKVSGQTRANHRNSLRRVCTDLKDAGKIADNPCVGLRIPRGQKPPPTTLSVVQAEALLRAFESDEQCRRILGWAVQCLLVGLRPESEAQRAEWSEINLRNAEQRVAGYKRGIKPRIAPLLPAAVAWLRVVKSDQEDKEGDAARPGCYFRHLRERAVIIANDWLEERHPKEPAIVWDEDILRHTYASLRAPLVSMEDLADDMGTSTTMIYSHYRHPKSARDAERFWALRPKAS